MAKKKIEVEVVVDDKGTTKKVALSQKQLSDALEKSGKSTDRATKRQRGLIETANSGGKNFANLASSITNGIVPAYAVLAAQVFAVTAAFQFLQEAANVRNLISAQEEYGAVTGIAYNRITKSLQEATDGQLRFQEAAQATAIGTAAGLSGEQLEGLATAAKNASFALGRDLTDSFNRLIRGVTKAEPELLDELGIILRLKPATEAYAASIGKDVEQLNAFERSQAVANFTLEEAERKFGSVGQVIDEEALAVQRFMKSFDDLSNTIKSAIVGVLNPILAFLSQNTLALTGALSIFAAPIVKSIIPSFEGFGKSAKKASRLARKGLSGATAEVNKAKEASENLVASQEKSLRKASKLAESGNIGKLGTGKKGGRGAVDFLSGTSDSKLAQRNAKRVLDAAQKEFDKYGRIRRGKLKGFNQQELKDLQQSYKLRVQASSTATKQIATKWQMLSAKQKVYAAKTRLAWKQAFVGIAKAGSMAPKLIDKAFRFASFAGLAFIFLDLAKVMLDAFFPVSDAVKKLNEELGEMAERLGDLNEHLEKVAAHRYKNVLDLNESVSQLGNAVQEANIPKFIKEIDVLSKTEDRRNKVFRQSKAAAEGSAESLVKLDSRFQPLLDAIRQGVPLTEEQTEAMKALGSDAVSATAALSSMRETQKSLNQEIANVVKGIPKAPLENLIVLYKNLSEAASVAFIQQQETFSQNSSRNQGRLNEIDNQLSQYAEENIKASVEGGEANRFYVQQIVDIQNERKELVNVMSKEKKVFEAIKNTNERNRLITIDLENSASRQLEHAQNILDNNLEISKTSKLLQDFDTRRERTHDADLRAMNGVETALQNQISAQAILDIAKRDANGKDTVALENAKRMKRIADDNVTLAMNNANAQFDINHAKRQELEIEKEKLDIFKRQSTEIITQRRRDAFTQFQTQGAGSIGRSFSNIQEDVRQNKLDKARSKSSEAQLAFEDALEDKRKAELKLNDMTIAQAERKIELARIQVAEANALVKTQEKSLDIAIDSLRLDNEKNASLSTLLMLDPIQREMEEFLLKKGFERKDLNQQQLALLEEHIRAQQQQKIVATGLNNIQGAFQSGIESSITNLTGGIGTLKQSFLDLGKSVVAALNQMIAKMLALQIASAFLGAFSPGASAGSSAPVAQNMSQGQINAQLASGGSVITRYGGFTEPRGYREGGIARGRHAGYGAILHGTEAVIPLAQGAKSIPVEFTGRGGQNQQNNVTVNVAMSSDGTVQSQTSTEDQGNVGKAIALAVQQELHKQKRPGGMLSPYGAGSG